MYKDYCLFEEEEFKWIEELAPSYKISSMTTSKNEFYDKYEVIKVTLNTRLSIASHVSLTFDALF